MPIDPTRIYEDANSGVLKILSRVIVLGVAVNTSVVAAVAGQRIRVMGLVAQSVGATAGSFQLKSNSAGTMISSIVFAPPITAGLTEKLPITDSGYFETSTGHGLFADATVASINLNVFYISYSP